MDKKKYSRTAAVFQASSKGFQAKLFDPFLIYLSGLIKFLLYIYRGVAQSG
jgi:hypothetical protein